MCAASIDSELARLARSRSSIALAEIWTSAVINDPKQHDAKLFNRLTQLTGAGAPSLPLSKYETLTIASKPKTAALCFDRVWTSRNDVPSEVRYWGATPLEIYTAATLVSLPSSRDGGFSDNFIAKEIFHQFIDSTGIGQVKDELGPSRDEIHRLANLTDQYLTNLITHSLSRFDEELRERTKNQEPSELYKLETLIKQSVIKYQQAAVWQASGKIVTPIYASEVEFETEYHEGERELVVPLLSNIALVDEDRLQWDQVVEFRKDKRSKEQYRRFINWLDTDCAGKSEDFIVNAIQVKLADYEAALNKHGIERKNGILAAALDPKGWVAGAAAAVAAHAVFPPLLMITGPLIPIVGNALLEVRKSRIKVDEITRGDNAVVAFIHDVGKLQK